MAPADPRPPLYEFGEVHVSKSVITSILALGLLSPALSFAGPKEEVIASVDKFLAAKSYHAAMTIGAGKGPATEMDFVAPDRVRVRMGPIGEQIIVGNTAYTTIQGKTNKTPAPNGGAAAYRDRTKILGNDKTIVVTSLGAETLGGVATKKYKIENTQPSKVTATFWIGPDGYPVQALNVAEFQGKPINSTIRYSRFNDASIRIDAPAAK